MVCDFFQKLFGLMLILDDNFFLILGLSDLLEYSNGVNRVVDDSDSVWVDCIWSPMI